MKVVIFHHKETKVPGSDFDVCIADHFTGVKTEMIRTVNNLEYRLVHHPDFFENEIYVFVADTKGRLLELTLLSHLMEDKRIILILPDESEETLRLAMKLSPRFATGSGVPCKTLFMVLEKMMGSKGRRPLRPFKNKRKV